MLCIGRKAGESIRFNFPKEEPGPNCPGLLHVTRVSSGLTSLCFVRGASLRVVHLRVGEMVSHFGGQFFILKTRANFASVGIRLPNDVVVVRFELDEKESEQQRSLAHSA